jgi:hypothetical protein
VFSGNRNADGGTTDLPERSFSQFAIDQFEAPPIGQCLHLHGPTMNVRSDFQAIMGYKRPPWIPFP